MNKRIDKFLLGLLWLLATTLGASFWFSTRFGFNVFMVSHWEYLGQLQASGEQIDSWFYVSIIVIVFLIFFGLFILVRTKLRKINFQTPENQNIIVDTPTATIEVKESILTPARPPRLSSQTASEFKPVQPVVRPLSTPVNPEPVFKLPETPANIYVPNIPTVSAPSIDSSKLEGIFRNAGYLIKKPLKLGNFRPDLFAIGIGEVLWIGAVDADPQKIIEASERLKSIFTETLEDIDIHIKSFIITTSDINGYDSIMAFKSIDELGDYINNNKNPEIKESEKEDFEAYSEYIDTVADYFNKL